MDLILCAHAGFTRREGEFSATILVEKLHFPLGERKFCPFSEGTPWAGKGDVLSLFLSLMILSKLRQRSGGIGFPLGVLLRKGVIFSFCSGSNVQ